MNLIEHIFSEDADFFLVDQLPWDTDFKSAEEVSVDHVSLDGQECDTKATLMEAFSSKLDFPDYFGHNWDALYDSFTELLWDLESNQYLVIFSKADALLNNGEEADTFHLLDVLKSSVEEVADEECDVKLKTVFLVNDAKDSHLGTVLVDGNFKARVVKKNDS